MSKKYFTIADAKREVDIEDVIEELGGTVQRGSFSTGWHPARCPFHQDKNASASVNPMLGRMVCHSCDFRGDVIDLAKEHLTTQDMKEALDWLAKTFL